MIRRPMVCILGAYLTGLLLVWYSAAVWLIIGMFLCSYLIIYLLMYRLKSRYIAARDRFLWCLPVLFLLGVLAMKAQLQQPGLMKAFVQETPCELTGRITMVVKKATGRAIYLKDVTVSLSQKESYPCEAVLAYTSDDQIYQIGNQILLKGSLNKFKKASNPGQFDEQLYYQIENIDFKAIAEKIIITDPSYSMYRETLSQIKCRLIRVYDTILGDKEAGVLIAMLLGEKYLLENELKELYQINGISHILAISGLHVSLIGMGIFWLLKKCRLRPMASTFLTIAFLYSYGVLTNFSVSTNRAIVMMVLSLLANLIGKTYDILSAMALSALLILLQNPLQLFSVGFLLSYFAVLGIVMIFPALKSIFPVKSKILDGLLVSVSATLATTPAVLYFYYQFPTYGILTNLLILPFITILTLSSLVAGVAGLLWLPLGTFLIGGSNYILKLYEGICRVNAQLPDSLITVGRPGSLVLLCCVCLLLLFLYRSKYSAQKKLLLYPIVGFLLLFLPHYHRGLEITMLEVGQGEAIYMETGSNNYLIDGGSSDISKVGTYRLLPFLKFQGVSRLDYAIVTHCDEDHVSGLKELMDEERFRIDKIILPKISQKDENYIALETLAREKKIEVYYIREGDTFHTEPLKVYCLHPFANEIFSTANSYSSVLSLSYGSFDMLLTGDLEAEGEEKIKEYLSEGYYNKKYGITPATDYDVLKVAHHGSKYSTTEEFLDLIKPELSLISCGRKNRYGHPHPELLERLEKVDSRIFITYEVGAIQIKTDGRKAAIKSWIRSSEN